MALRDTAAGNGFLSAGGALGRNGEGAQLRPPRREGGREAMGDTSRSALKGSPSLGSALSGLQIFFENYQEWGGGGGGRL